MNTNHEIDKISKLLDGELRSVSYVKPLSNYTLFLKFDNNKEKIFDLKPYLYRGGVFEKLEYIDTFNKVYVDDGTVTWDDETDLCSDSLYISSTPIEIFEGIVNEIASISNRTK